MIWIFIFASFSVVAIARNECSGETCSLPLIDHMKAALYADLDMSKIITSLKNLIETEIRKEMDTVKRNLSEEMNEVKNRTIEMKEDMITLVQQEIESNVNKEIKRQNNMNVAELKKELGTNIDDIKNLTKTMVTELKRKSETRVDDIRIQTKTMVTKLKQELGTYIDDVRNQTQTMVTQLKQEFVTNADLIKKETHTIVTDLEHDIGTKLYVISSLLNRTDVLTMDFTFNRSSLHKDRYINEDNTLIINAKTTDTVSSQGLGFKNYKGVMTDKCCIKDQEMNFGILFQYDIKSTIEDKHIVFEVGLAEQNEIDKHFYVGVEEVGGWSFFIANYQSRKYLSLFADHRPLITWNNILNHFSANTQGTNKTGVLHFNINRNANTFSVVSNQNKLYTFTNVMSEKDLCPVFGLYNSHLANVSLRLLYSTILP